MRRSDAVYKFFCWNWCIRLIIEAAMELSFCVFLNLTYTTWDGSTVAMKINYVISCFYGVCLVLIVPFIIIFYSYNFKKLKDEEFEEKWGAPYEGLRVESKWALLFPVSFVVRRGVFAYFSIFMPNFLIGQLAI
jgi:hypothetical protein